MATQIVKPDLPSTVVQWTGEESISLPPNENQTVAIVSPHNWGPLGVNASDKVYTTLSQWESDYGTDDTPARVAVIGAFKGMGLQGEGGAGGVIFHRLAVAADAVAANGTIRNTNTGGAEDALTLTALWTGTRGNDISYVVEPDPNDAAKDRLRILYKGSTQETYSYPERDITGLTAAINARPSRYVTARMLRTGETLAATAGTSLARGANGDTLTVREYEEAQRALEYRDFGVFAPAALTDVPTKVQLVEWERQMAAEMRPFRLVLGGAARESIDDAMAELVANPTLRDTDGHVIRFAVGTWLDTQLDVELSTAQLAPRIAGILAARGERSALTRALLADLVPVGNTGATTEELRVGRDAGLTMLRRVSHDLASVAISQGVTTFIDRATRGRPYVLFSEPRIVGLLDRVLRQMVQWGDDVVIGDLPVTDDTRNLVRKEVLKILGELESTGLAEPGSSYCNVDPPDDPALADAIPYEFGFVPTRTANYLIGNGKVR